MPSVAAKAERERARDRIVEIIDIEEIQHRERPEEFLDLAADPHIDDRVRRESAAADWSGRCPCGAGRHSAPPCRRSAISARCPRTSRRCRSRSRPAARRCRRTCPRRNLARVKARPPFRRNGIGDVVGRDRLVAVAPRRIEIGVGDLESRLRTEAEMDFVGQAHVIHAPLHVERSEPKPDAAFQIVRLLRAQIERSPECRSARSPCRRARRHSARGSFAPCGRTPRNSR